MPKRPTSSVNRKKIVRIIDVNQGKSFGRCGRTRPTTVFRFDQPAKIIDTALTAPYLEHGTDHRAHHIPQETIGLNRKHPSCSILLPSGFIDPAIIRLHIGMQLAEARKIRIVVPVS